MDQEQAKEAEQASSSTSPSPAKENDFEQKRKLIGILSYLSVLVLIAYSMADKDERLMFHVRQGALLCLVEIAALILASTIFILAPFLMILQVVFLVFTVIGILNVLNNRNKELPLIGHLAVHLPL